ncbi:hypothetical protein P5V15_009961 [Pogonomyrmex californicus]
MLINFKRNISISIFYLSFHFIIDMNIVELIKLLLYGSLILNYVTALYQHKENVFDKPKISNKRTDRSKTTRTRRSEITEINKKGTSNDTQAYIVSTTVQYITPVNFRLPDFIIPKKYKIDLRLNTEEDIFSGKSNITIMIYKPTQYINLHSANLEITSCKLTNIIDGVINLYRRRNIIYIHKLQIVVLDFLIALHPGKYNLSMSYKGVIDNDGGGFIKMPYINATGHIKWLIATSNSAIGMRRLFPCWDEPGIKAKFTIAIQYPKHYNVFSNTPFLLSTLTMTRFVTTPKIPTYRIAILLLDKNDYIHISPVQNLELWRRKLVEEQWNQILKLINDVTVVVEFIWRPEESLMRNKYAIAGLTDDSVDKMHFELYREEDIIYNEEIDPVARKIESSRIIGRKVVGQLFGTAVSPSWWSYMWLNEGIATLFGVYIINKIMPDIRMLDLFVVQTQQESLRLDDSQIMKPLGSEVNSISEINSLFSFTYYIKAPSILRMLHHTVGDEIFQKGIEAHMKRKTGSLDDFWTIMQSTYDSQTMDLEKIRVKDLMNPWIQEKQYPILNVTQTYGTERSKIVLKTASKNWTVPLTNQVYINLKRILPKFCLARKQKHFLAKCYNSEHSQFIIINRQQTGYYRVFYNRKSWLRIVRYLNSKNCTNINVLNRAQIIDDTFHLTISGELDFSVFWEVVSYLKWERDYIPWYSMFKAVEHMSYILPFHSTDSATFKNKLLMQLGPLLQKIGYEEKPNDDSLIKCLRQEALRWACVLGDGECKKHAEFKLRWHLLNPT